MQFYMEVTRYTTGMFDFGIIAAWRHCPEDCGEWWILSHGSSVKLYDAVNSRWHAHELSLGRR